mgnify:CR=1 FL=1
MGYNTSDRSGVTRKLLRPPDFCFWVDNTLVFMVSWWLSRSNMRDLPSATDVPALVVQGEVKTNSGDIGAAVQELGTKMGKLVFADDCEGCHFRCKSLSHAVLFNRRCVVAHCFRQTSVPALLRGRWSKASSKT